MKYYFIVNPNSGKRDITPEILEHVRQYFEGEGAGLEYEVVVTHDIEAKTHAVRRICESSAGQPVRICACGGDGTLNGVAGAVVGHSNVEIGYFPGGSGNDFIKCFAPAEEFRSIAAFVEGKSHLTDIIRVNDGYCLNLFSVGVDADVNYCLPKYRRIPLLGGPMGYNMAVLENFFKPMGKKLRVTVGEQSFEGCFMLSAFGNGRVYGGGYYATPEAEVDDGMMDIILIDKISKLKVATVLGIYKKGEHIKSGEVADDMKSYVHFFRGTKATVEGDCDFVVNVDGEAFIARRIEAEIVPNAIRFIAP